MSNQSVTNKSVVGAAATALTLLAATACATGTDTAGPEVGAAEGTITWYAMPFGPTGLPQALIDAFEAEHPDITVEFQAAPTNSDTVRGTLTTEISGGSTAIDVFNGDVVWPAQFGDAGLALPLDDYVPDDYWDRFAPGRADASVHEGEHLAAPLFTDQGFLVYRTDLLEAADLPVPTTWEELAETARTLQESGEVEYGYAGQWANYEGLTVNWAEMSADAGAGILTPDGAEPAIDSPESARALEYMRDLIDTGVTPTAATTFEEQDAQQLFTAGRVAFLRNWGYAYGDANTPETSEVVDQVGITALPTFEGQEGPGHSAVGGWDLMVNPHTENMGAVLAFLEWMTGPDAQRILAEDSMIPANGDVLADTSLHEDNPVLAAAADARLVSRPSGTPAYPQVSEAVYTNVNSALAGSATVDEALAVADEQIATALDEGL